MRKNGINFGLNNMMYLLSIRSHCEAPDFEVEMEADNKQEALEKILNKYPYLEELGNTLLLKHLGKM